MAEQADICSFVSRLNSDMAPVRMDRLSSHSFHLPFSYTVFGLYVLVVESLFLRSQVRILTSISIHYTKDFTTLYMYVVSKSFDRE